MKIWLTRFACWIRKATNTHSVYVTLSQFSDSLWNMRSRDRIPVEARFSVTSRPGQGPFQPPIQRVTGLFPGGKAARTWC